MIFPVEKLKPVSATIWAGHFQLPCIEIHFDPFTVEQNVDGDVIAEDLSNPLRADEIALPSAVLADLQGQSFEFPTNPDEGYVDASIYFGHAHNPVDITKLSFGPLSGPTLALSVTCRWLMTFEGTAQNDFDYSFDVPLGAKA